MEKGVKQIKVTLTTGDVGLTNGATVDPNQSAVGRRYLGIGGREFLLEYGDIAVPQFAFTKGKVDTFILGAKIGNDEPNTTSPEFNDPRIGYIMTEEYLDKFETYLRYEPGTVQNTGAEYMWRLDQAIVDVTLSLGNLTFPSAGQNNSGSVRYSTLTRKLAGGLGQQQGGDALWLSSQSSRYVYLKREEALDVHIAGRDTIRMMIVKTRTSFDTFNHPDSATGSRVWLGIGGREFFLERDNHTINDFRTGASEVFVLGGEEPNILNALLNDPSGPGPHQSTNYPIAEGYLDNFPVYVRFERNPAQDAEWRVDGVEVVAYKRRPPNNDNTDLIPVRKYEALRGLGESSIDISYSQPPTPTENPSPNTRMFMLMHLGNQYLFLKRSYDLPLV